MTLMLLYFFRCPSWSTATAVRIRPPTTPRPVEGKDLINKSIKFNLSNNLSSNSRQNSRKPSGAAASSSQNNSDDEDDSFVDAMDDDDDFFDVSGPVEGHGKSTRLQPLIPGKENSISFNTLNRVVTNFLLFR